MSVVRGQKERRAIKATIHQKSKRESKKKKQSNHIQSQKPCSLSFADFGVWAVLSPLAGLPVCLQVPFLNGGDSIFETLFATAYTSLCDIELMY